MQHRKAIIVSAIALVVGSPLVLVTSSEPAQAQQRIHECGLAMIDMGNNRNISQIYTFHHHTDFLL